MTNIRSRPTPKTLNRYSKSLKELIDAAKSDDDWSELDKLESNIGYLQDLIDYYRLRAEQPIKNYTFFDEES